jgi:UDP-N-acetylmuramate--alanine ligase
MTIYVGHDASHVGDVEFVVVSSAIRDENPEVAQAHRLGIPVIHRSQALGDIANSYRLVAVAGTHGKTTTSAMIAAVAVHAGIDPSFAIGAALIHSGSAARLGSGDVMIIEADESDGSFVNYEPEVIVVTNIEMDHQDHFGTLDALDAVFDRFVARLRPGGLLIVCGDDPGALRLASRYRQRSEEISEQGSGRVMTYGIANSDVDVRVETRQAADAQQVVLTVTDRLLTNRLLIDLAKVERYSFDLPVMGDHNALNAAAAAIASRELGVDEASICEGLAGFVGTARRFESRGTVNGVEVIDDYAHHPTEIAATLNAARQYNPTGNIIVVFQPHLYSRTRSFLDEFARVLSRADAVILTEIYAAREKPDPTISARHIIDRIASIPRYWEADLADAATCAARIAQPGDLIVTMGAGDITTIGPRILEALEASEASSTL